MIGRFPALQRVPVAISDALTREIEIYVPVKKPELERRPARRDRVVGSWGRGQASARAAHLDERAVSSAWCTWHQNRQGGERVEERRVAGVVGRAERLGVERGREGKHDGQAACEAWEGL